MINAINLYMYSQPHCPACLKARPHFERFKALRPAVVSIELDVTKPVKEIGGRVKSTPRYVIVVNNEVVFAHEGVMTTQQIDRTVRNLLGDE